MHKFYFLLMCCAVMLTACDKKYNIEGISSVSRLDGKMLFIKVPSNGQMVNIDSAEVIHGLFKMEGKVDSTVIGSLYMDDEVIMPFVIENGKININIDNSGITIKGTPLNDSFNDFVMKKNSLDDRAYDVERLESRMIMDGENPETIRTEIEKKRAEISDEMDKLAKEFIQTNYENVLGPGVFIMLCNTLPYPMMTPVLDEIVEKAPDSFKNNPMIKEYVSVARSNMEQIRSMSSN